MKPVDQTIFGDGSDGQPHGDCFRACVASILELLIGDVPHFVEDGSKPGKHWIFELAAWLRLRGLAYIEAPADAPSIYGMLHVAKVHYIAMGPAARGFGHATVELDGDLVHDPHPSRAGLLKPERFGFFVALHPERLTP